MVLLTQCIIDVDVQQAKTEVKESLEMEVGVDDRGLAIEAIATLAHLKSNMVSFVLNPAGVPEAIYRPLFRQRDHITGRLLSKKQMAPLLLNALEGRNGYADIVGNIVSIAASWQKFELSYNEYQARAVKAKAQEILKRQRLLEAEEVARESIVRRERHDELLVARKQELGLLLAMFDELAGREQDAQKRGYLLQELLNRLFVAFEIPVHQSFTRNKGGEQIDGAFRVEGWSYLAECRWRREPSDMGEVDGLSGKVSRSGTQTMGLFLSINGWSRNVPGLLKQNPHKVIILMQGFDLRTILSEEVDLRGYILAAVENLNIRAEPHLDVREYLKQTA